MRFIPSQDFLLIDEIKEARSGGIVLPENITLEWQRGKVKGVGPGKYALDGTLVEPHYKVGEVVVFSGPTATDIEIEGEKFKLIHSNNVFGVLEDESAI